jgi:hypothetical protein
MMKVWQNRLCYLEIIINLELLISPLNSSLCIIVDGILDLPSTVLELRVLSNLFTTH